MELLSLLLMPYNSIAISIWILCNLMILFLIIDN